jgi:hypothetical protein
MPKEVTISGKYTENRRLHITLNFGDLATADKYMKLLMQQWSTDRTTFEFVVDRLESPYPIDQAAE